MLSLNWTQPPAKAKSDLATEEEGGVTIRAGVGSVMQK